MTFHRLFGMHRPDPSGHRWDNGLLVSTCRICGGAMVKPAGEDWRLARTRW